ncbi:MAG: OmpH family outer membrane protein [Bacteroidetes bacterium]|nr:OmpH family outer membrane protein [Bacteroidota bacterium]
MKKLILFCALVVAQLTTVQAQTIKLGHINSNQLLSAMPETKKADSVLTKFGQSLQSQLEMMTNEYQSKAKDLDEKQASMIEAVRDAKIKELNDLETRIREFQQSAQDNASKKKEEIYAPIIKAAEDAIKSVAKEKGYTYIFDSGVGVLLYSNESDDILPMVKEKLKLK